MFAPVKVALNNIGYGIATALLWVGARCLRAIVAHRPLHRDELEAARDIFGCSIDLHRVRVADIPPYTNYMRRIPFLGSGYFAAMDLVIAPYPLTLPVLIHELTHVWQSRDGPAYMTSCLLEHARLGEDVYEVQKDVLATGGDLRALGFEQQAAVVERYYALRFHSKRPRSEWRLLERWARQVFEPCHADLQH
jgi:hypothetical protein